MGWLESGDLDHRGHLLQNDLPLQIHSEIERLDVLPRWTAYRLMELKGEA